MLSHGRPGSLREAGVVLARALLEFQAVHLVAIFARASYRSGGLSELDGSPEGWVEARPAMDAGLGEWLAESVETRSNSNAESRIQRCVGRESGWSSASGHGRGPTSLDAERRIEDVGDEPHPAVEVRPPLRAATQDGGSPPIRSHGSCCGKTSGSPEPSSCSAATPVTIRK